MQYISPLNPGSDGKEVANLHSALRFLIEKSVIKLSQEDKTVVQNFALEQGVQLYGKATQSLVLLFQRQNGMDGQIGIVNDSTAIRMNERLKWAGAFDVPVVDNVPEFVVRGSVKDSNGKPQPGYIIRAYDKDLRNEQLLGKEALTDEYGNYSIEYKSADFANADAESPAPDLLVRLFTEDRERVLEESPIRFNAGRVEIVDFIIRVAGISEWEKLCKAIEPLLKGQGKSQISSHLYPSAGQFDLPPYEITEEDIDFIRQDAQLSEPEIRAWVASAKMVREADQSLNEEHIKEKTTVGEFGWPFFYAMIRGGLPDNLKSFLATDPSNWSQVWKVAVSANHVPAIEDKDIKRLIAALEVIRNLHVLSLPEDAGNPLARIFSSVSIPPSRRLALDVLAIVRERGMDNTEDLMPLIDKHPDSKSSINLLVRGLRVNKLVNGNEKLFQSVSSKLEGVSNSIEPLAKLALSDWANMANETSTSHSNALRMQVSLEREHPMSALKSRLEANRISLGDNLKNAVQEFITTEGPKAEDILLGKVPIDDDPDLPETHKTLKNLGRFVRVGLNFEFASKLIGAGAKTPAIALRYGREHIREQLREDYQYFDFGDAIDKFVNLTNTYVNAGVQFITTPLADLKVLPTWVHQYTPPASPTVRANLPTLTAFFGDQNECMCEPCESMLGQPAYLVDLLNLLKTCIFRSTNIQTALDALELRRRDIPNLELTCEKAQTPIQHIDKVLRILEQNSLPYTGSPSTSTLPIEEPIVEAYDQPASSTFPWILPFELRRSETKAYMQELKVSRLDLILLNPSVNANIVAAETLDASFDQTSPTGFVSEWKLLTSKKIKHDLWFAYGFKIFYPASVPAGTYIIPDVVDPASAEVLKELPVTDVLCRISFLLDRTGLNLDTLEKIIATDFIGKLNITGREKCKTSEMRLAVPTGQVETVMDKLHRFVRLSRKLTAWSIEELDNVLSAVPVPTTDADWEATLVKIAQIKRLSERYNFPIGLLLKLPITLPEVCAIQGITARDYSILAAITGINLASTPVNWGSVESFFESVQRITEMGLSIEQAAEALLTRAQLGALPIPIAPVKTDAEISSFLKEVQEHLKAINAVDSTTELKNQAIERLTEVFDLTRANLIVEAISKAAAGSISPALQNEVKGILHDKPEDKHELGEWSPLLTDTVSQNLVATGSGSPNLDSRLVTLLESIMPRRLERALLEKVSQLSGLLIPEIIPLLSHRLLLDKVSTQPDHAYTLFTDTAFLDDTNSNHASTLTRLSAWVDRLFRFIRLKSLLPLDVELLDLAEKISTQNQKAINWRNLLGTKLPASSTGPNADWNALHDLIWLQDPQRIARPTLIQLLTNLESTTLPADALKPLANRFGFTLSRTEDIIRTVLGVTDFKKMLNVSQLKQAFNALAVARNLNTDGIQIQQLANIQDNAQAAIVSNALVEAKVSENSRPDIFKRINDPLRAQRRDAMVAFLASGSPFENANKLYEHFLIDPLVEPSMDTTLTLEAISATQLFAQRVLFGLEPNIEASEELKSQWTWMKNYRVWEANRKVYLFRQNYLFPELRDDKSSSFKQMESALGQGELTNDLAKEVFGQFLDDVAQMGQVQVLGMYEDLSISGYNVIRGIDGLPQRRTLFVVGRSQNPPYAYFWRKCRDFGSTFMEWSPWLRIELDIQGDHVLPFVLGGEFYIAWPIIKFNAQQAPKEDQWEVKLAWSRFDGRNWRKASISREQANITNVPFSDETRGFSFRCKITGDGSIATVLGYFIKKDENARTTKPVAAPDQTFPNNLDASFYYPGIPSSNSSNGWAQLINLQSLIERNFANALEISIVDKDERSFRLKQHLGVYTQRGLSGDSNRIFFNDPIQAITYLQPPFPNELALRSKLGEYLKDLWNDTNTTTNRIFEKVYDAINRSSSNRNVWIEAWIKLGESSDLKKLMKDKGSFSLVINGEYHSIGLERGYSILKLGNQPADSIKLRVTINGIPLDSSVESLSEVKAGTSVNQSLVFQFDVNNIADENKRQPFINALGLDINSNRALVLASQFNLTVDDIVSIQEGDKSPLTNSLVAHSIPWMNGYQEKSIWSTPASKYVAQSPLMISGDTIFESGINTTVNFWVVQASANDLIPSNVWHFSENGVSRYVDLDKNNFLSDSGFLIYPNSYKEAGERRSRWVGSGILDEKDNQLSTFQSHQWPEWPAAASGFVTPNWTRAQRGELTFDSRMPYACYNWEVFFHAPIAIADQLSKQQKFEDAERWLRYIFDPTSGGQGSDPKRFLKFRVFRELNLDKQVIDDLEALAQAASGYYTSANVGRIKKIIGRWKAEPFRPFVIARGHHIAFLWWTLFAYLDNLIAWADSLYRRDTRESNNEAMMLYVLAMTILGRRPQQHKGKSKRTAHTYNQLKHKLDDFSNFWIDAGGLAQGTNNHSGPVGGQPQASEGMMYFCMPFNDKILGYWTTLDDRLFNLRHCRNIEGIERKLPFTDAPISVELLVRAVAAGLNLGDVINGLYAPPPHYRYAVLSARASELVSETKALGAAMLSAIEKRDAEQLTLLRSSNEISLLKLVSEVKKLQINEAQSNIDALRASRKSVSTRYAQYQRLLGKKDIKVPGEQEITGEESMMGNTDTGMTSHRSGLGLIKEENEQYIGFEAANTWSMAANISKIAGGGFHTASAFVPESIGKKLTGLGTASSMIGDAFSMVSQGWRNYADQQGMMAGHLRRRDEWAFQSNQTLKELQQIDKQILANEIRIEITRKELANHTEQMEQSKAMDEMMRNKFSNEQLYEWMVKQLSGLYFSTYRLAVDMAKRVELAAVRELGDKPLNVIRSDHWDSLRMGLLSGERLHQDLKRLEIAYMENNRREHELTKNVSLAMLDPHSLMNLRTLGTCDFEIPEALFDLDHPGHYYRRIKSVSLSIPCIAGPHTTVGASLSLISNKYRMNSQGSSYVEVGNDDPRFNYNMVPIQSMATSHGQNDSGLFELNFRDERYLPFELAGAISRWTLEFPKEVRQFDYQTISDVIIHVKYTARNGGALFKQNAEGSMKAQLEKLNSKGLQQAISLKHDMPNEWNSLINSKSTKIKIEELRFPYFYQSLKTKYGAKPLEVYFMSEQKTSLLVSGSTTPLTFPPENGLQKSGSITVSSSTNEFTLSIPTTSSLPDKDKDILMIVKYW